MNYLTNYYKNLSEKLQHQVDLLNEQHRMLSEAMTSYGSYQSDDDTGLTDLNGDGMVDGADLGLYLAKYGHKPGSLSNWNSGGNAFAPKSQAVGPRQGGRQREAADLRFSGGNAGRPQLPGDLNGDGRVDGADIGLALGQGKDPSEVMGNWSDTGTDQFSSRFAPAVQGGRGRPGIPSIGPGEGAGSDMTMGGMGKQNVRGIRPQTGQPYSGQELGKLLGAGNPQAWLNYLRQYGNPTGTSMNRRDLPISRRGTAGSY